MRVIAGSAKGIRLAAPPDQSIRPTLDRVREAVFNVLAPELEGAKFLDLFAGTGANGIEALSRGAASAVFVESNRNAAELIRENLQRTKLAAHARILAATIPRCFDALKAQAPFDIVYADPPHALEQLDQILDDFAKADLLSTGGLLVVEHSRRRSLKEQYGPLVAFRQNRYGDTAISFFRHQPTDGGEGARSH